MLAVPTSTTALITSIAEKFLARLPSAVSTITEITGLVRVHHVLVAHRVDSSGAVGVPCRQRRFI